MLASPNAACPGVAEDRPQDQIIVALDVPDVPAAQAIVKELGDHISFYKIGMQLQFNGGIEYAERLAKDNGKRVFLDSKLFDIGTTIELAVKNIIRMGVTFLTVRGDKQIVRSAVKARTGSDLKILAVTVLTSLDQTDLAELGINMTIAEYVKLRTQFALDAGADGVIASGQEAEMIRELAEGRLKIITPGIRPPGSAHNDQRRVSTPEEAISAGADYLVIGRPILEVKDKIKRIHEIALDIERGRALKKMLKGKIVKPTLSVPLRSAVR
jgi:orotidine-5'-phosphate decarboxylase